MKINDKHIQKGFEMRDNLIKSAISLFSSRGFDGTSVKDITDSAGCPKSLFYHYFSSKEEILETIIRQYELRVTSDEKDTVLKNSTKEGFGDIVSRIYLKIQEEPDILRLIIIEALKNEQIMNAFMEKIDVLASDFNLILPEDIHENVGEEELVVFRFYFRFAPIILFSLTKECIAHHYGYTPDAFEKRFLILLKYNPYLSKSAGRSENEDIGY